MRVDKRAAELRRGAGAALRALHSKLDVLIRHIALCSSRSKGARARIGYVPSARSARSPNVCLNRKSSSTSFNREAELAAAPLDKFISKVRRAARTRLCGSDRWQLPKKTLRGASTASIHYQASIRQKCARTWREHVSTSRAGVV
jgi:hypothetical protein